MSAVSEEDPSLCCPVCLDEYDDSTCIPKLLACHHSACVTCLQDLLTNEHIECPTCRKVTRCKCVLWLSTNFYVSHIRNLVVKNKRLRTENEKTSRNDIWCQACRGHATMTCINEKHNVSDYDAYVVFLNVENKLRLINLIDDMKGFLQSFDELKDLVKRATDETSQKLLELPKYNDVRRPMDGSVEFAAGLKTVEDTFKAFLEGNKVGGVNAVAGMKTLMGKMEDCVKMFMQDNNSPKG